MKKFMVLVILIIPLLISGCTQTQPTPPEDPGWQIQGKMDHRYGIFTMNIDGTGLVQIYGSDNPVSSASLSSTGRLIFQEMDIGGLDAIQTSEIIMIKIDGEGYTKLTDNDWMDFQPVWSRDGEEILFVSNMGLKTGTEIYLMDLDGNITNRLTNTVVLSEADPDWKCSKIVYTRNHSIWIMDDNGSNQKQLTDPFGKGTYVGVQFPIGDYDPSLSSDCDMVVFSRLVGPGPSLGETQIGDYDLYVYDIDTGTETDISKNDAADFVPKWYPGGFHDKIIFIHVTDVIDDTFDIYMINPDGTGRTKVTGDDPSIFIENGCSWLSRDRILFTAEFYE
jgi:Tol biopolymer transport system component